MPICLADYTRLDRKLTPSKPGGKPSHQRKSRRLLVGLAFIGPNLTGFLVFTLTPLVISFAFAFSNWDLHLHNIFRNEPLVFVGLDHFRELFSHPEFLQFFGNTLFLMMGIPFAIAGSLGAALLLSSPIKRRPGWNLMPLGVAGVVLVASLSVLTLTGFQLPGLMLLFVFLFIAILAGGMMSGMTVYRTLFYTPHFTAGVATYVLWKKLYDPQTGPINSVLSPVLEGVASTVTSLPPAIFSWGSILLLVGAAELLRRFVRSGLRSWYAGESGWLALFVTAVLGSIVCIFVLRWSEGWAGGWIPVAGFLAGLWVRPESRPDRAGRNPLDHGLGVALMLGLLTVVAVMTLYGISSLSRVLPTMAVDGLEPPLWLADYHWAKPSIMIMALWAAIGSNNMILYLAGLSNIPSELYEAASMDGASGRQRFWFVTWPQLAPVTFFIFIMSIIQGLQGGFEMARTMTKGGPAGATTTLSYFVYIEGFETGRLGFASSVAWALFALVFAVTALNFKFGSRYTND